MFFNRRARFGLQPTLVIQNQYLNPHAKTALCAVAIILLGFLSFIGGTVYQMIENTDNVTVNLELPQNTSLYNIDYKPIYVMDNDYEYFYSGLIPFEWNPSAEEHAKEIDCLAKNIYFEARNENIDGKLAVGLVTINRVLDPEFPETICDVVWQKRRHPSTKKWVAQFSWTWDGKDDKPLNRAKWYEARTLASVMLSENSLYNFFDFTHGAIYYHADYVNPWWSKKLLELGYKSTQIDTHILYTKRGRDVFTVVETDSR